MSPKAAKNRAKQRDLSNEEEAYEAIFSGGFGALEIDNFIGGTGVGEDGATEHLPDAIDFEDEDELAEDELSDEQPVENGGSGSGDMHIDSQHIGSGLYPHFVSSHGEELSHGVFDGGNDSYMPILPHENNQLIMGDMPPSDEFQGANNALFMDVNEGANNMDSMLMMNNNMATFEEFPTMDNKLSGISEFDGKYAKQSHPGAPGVEHLPEEQAEFNKRDQYRDQISIRQQEKANRDKALLRYYFPDFKRGKVLKWNRTIYRKRKEYPWKRDALLTRKTTPLFPMNLRLQIQADQQKAFKTSTGLPGLGNPQNRKGIVSVSLDELYPEEIVKKKEEIKEDNELPDDLLIVTDDWDQEKIIDNKLDTVKSPGVIEECALLLNRFDYNDSVGLSWDEEKLVEGKLNESRHAELDMNDERLLLLIQGTDQPYPEGVNTSLGVGQPAQVPRSIQQQQQQQLEGPSFFNKFNISNDDTYNALGRAHQPRIRVTVSNLNIEHSQPAIKLQSPFYRVNLPKSQLRFFHRQKFGQHLRPGTVITFSKLKTRKRKRDKGKDVRESFATSVDLTLGDTAPIYLMEYSEESPMALSKFGMCSKVINYYRKISEQDTLRPKLPVGETHVLGVQDKSPFWNFGTVEPGHIVPMLYNNMIRAPIFNHKVSPVDFLLIRSTGHGISNKFYLRHINHLFTVGQTFPAEEIPGPNSRRVTSMKSTRLRMIVYRMLNRTPDKAISIEPINKHFPDQDYGQNRQKVKEFMKYQRDGPDKGLWKLKEGETLLDNESVRKLISPELVSEVDTMHAGLQSLEDNKNYNVDDKLIKLEESLLPWNTSRNFINATQMRTMVQIHGAGDPTGCGEGFSFMKTSMKGGFVRANSTNSLSDFGAESPASTTSTTTTTTATTTTAAVATGKKDGSGGSSATHGFNLIRQQKAYEDEIKRTWFVHAKSLSVVDPYEEMENPDGMNPTYNHVKSKREDGKVLRIHRKRRDHNGIIQRQTIIIRDPRVIKGYLKGREVRRKAKLDVNKLIEEDNMNLAINNVEEIEMQRRLLQTELASLEKSQQRRAARQSSKKRNQQQQQQRNQKATPGDDTNITGTSNESGAVDGGNGKMAQDGEKPGEPVDGLNGSPNTSRKSKNTNRRCATCGQTGHIRTNKSCPLYHLRNEIGVKAADGSSHGNVDGSSLPGSPDAVPPTTTPATTTATVPSEFQGSVTNDTANST